MIRVRVGLAESWLLSATLDVVIPVATDFEMSPLYDINCRIRSAG